MKIHSYLNAIGGCDEPDRSHQAGPEAASWVRRRARIALVNAYRASAAERTSLSASTPVMVVLQRMGHEEEVGCRWGGCVDRQALGCGV